MRILVDTNVFLDLMLKREGCIDAIKFFAWCRLRKNQIFITSMSMRDIEYTATRFYHDKLKGQMILSDVYSLCSKVIGVSADAAITAIYEDYKDYEDELMVQSAKEAMLDAIVTNNIKDFENCGFPVFKPGQLTVIAS